jgi:uncharacterized protein YaeQ
VALTATIYNVSIDLADTDRGVYETLEFRAARHPSESETFLAARVLAYALEYREGIAFSSGLSTPDEPAIAIRDLTGTITDWIDIGCPDADRLHKAAKAARRVAVYAHRDPAQWLRQLQDARIHRAGVLDLHAFDPACLAAFAGRLDRRMAFGLTVTDRHLMIATNDAVIEGPVQMLPRP